MHLQRLCEPVRPGSGLRQAYAGKRPHPQLAAAELRLQARGRRPRSLLVASPDFAAFGQDRKSTRLNSSHANISYAVFCLKKKKRYFSIVFLTPPSTLSNT